MKIIRFLGGLGNQMFQYACYKSLRKTYPNVKADLNSFDIDTAHNGYELEEIFDLDIEKVSKLTGGIYDIKNRKWKYRKIRRIFGLKKYHKEEEKDFTYDPSIFYGSQSRYYSGFWQNEQYFIDVADEIRKDFCFRPISDQKNLETLKKIKESNSVSIHIRRGDYVNHPAFGGLCDKSYYQEAIKLIHSKVDLAALFVFSNDIEWCRTNLEIPNAEFISWNKGKDSYIDMQLMSNCKHNIIANSSFSWWAAWLNNNYNKVVIGPKKWLHGDFDTSSLLPKTWIKL